MADAANFSAGRADQPPNQDLKTQEPKGTCGGRAISWISNKWSNASTLTKVGIVTTVAAAIIGAVAITHGAALLGVIAFGAAAGAGVWTGEESITSAIKAAQHNRVAPSTICLEDVEASKETPPELNSAQQERSTVTYGTAESIGRTGIRGSEGEHPQEDRIVEGEITWNGQSYSFTGVADGHGRGTHGAYASDYVQKNFTNYLQKELAEESKLTQGTIQKAAKQAVGRLNQEISDQEDIIGTNGTTLTGTLFFKGKSVSISVGDSQTLLCRKGQPPKAQGTPEDISDPKIYNSLVPPPPKHVKPTVSKTAIGLEKKTYTWSNKKTGLTYVVTKQPYEDRKKGNTTVDKGVIEKRNSYDTEMYEKGHKVEINVLSIDTMTEGSKPGTVVRLNDQKVVSDIGVKGARTNVVFASHTSAKNRGEERMVSVSDGITDVLTNDEINSLIWQMEGKGYTEQQMAEGLVKAAFMQESKDNLSATVSRVK